MVVALTSDIKFHIVFSFAKVIETVVHSAMQCFSILLSTERHTHWNRSLNVQKKQNHVLKIKHFFLLHKVIYINAKQNVKMNQRFFTRQFITWNTTQCH